MLPKKIGEKRSYMVWKVNTGFFTNQKTGALLGFLLSSVKPERSSFGIFGKGFINNHIFICFHELISQFIWQLPLNTAFFSMELFFKYIK
ncbi:MAG: hypothetical protein JSV83_13400 [Desulfobacterales bacterium]|nr:MAG: hypothetical protein JSV83_13400 [Desulfobacterales bacterium]